MNNIFDTLNKKKITYAVCIAAVKVRNAHEIPPEAKDFFLIVARDDLEKTNIAGFLQSNGTKLYKSIAEYTPSNKEKYEFLNRRHKELTLVYEGSHGSVYEQNNNSFKQYLQTLKESANVVFHGGCLGCISQRIHGIDRCKGCQYFKGNWSKPNLHIEGEEASTMSEDDFKSNVRRSNN